MRFQPRKNRVVVASPEMIRGYVATVLATDHAAFDYEMIAREARLLVDTRGAFRTFAADMGERLIRA